MAKVSAKGSFHLLWGLVISTVISSIATIFVARLLGSDLYGLVRNRADRTQPHWSIPRLGHKLSNGPIHRPIPIRRQSIRSQKHTHLWNNLRNSPRNGVIRNIFCALRLSRNKRVPSPRNNFLNSNSLNLNLSRRTHQRSNSSIHRHRKNGTKQHHAHLPIHNKNRNHDCSSHLGIRHLRSSLRLHNRHGNCRINRIGTCVDSIQETAKTNQC